MIENNDNDDYDFVRYIKNNKTDKKHCCSWKICCISTCLAWTLTTVVMSTTVGVLIWKKYIVIDFQNPNYIFDY